MNPWYSRPGTDRVTAFKDAIKQSYRWSHSFAIWHDNKDNDYLALGNDSRPIVPYMRDRTFTMVGYTYMVRPPQHRYGLLLRRLYRIQLIPKNEQLPR
jgi:hypothetical protein